MNEIYNITMWKKGWFLSSNAKNIGTLLLMFSLFSGLVRTAFSVLIWLELSGLNLEDITLNQLYNSIIIVYAIIMIFFTVMPAIIGRFDNLLLPLMTGGPDMAFPRLNNISFWLLPPSLLLFLFTNLIEDGAGTGWMLYPPLSGLQSHSGFSTNLVIFVLLISAISSLLGAMNFISIILSMRVPSIRLHKHALLGRVVLIIDILLLSILLLLSLPMLTEKIAISTEEIIMVLKHIEFWIFVSLVITYRLNKYLQYFEVKTLIGLSIKFRIIIWIISLLFVCFNWKISILYSILYLLIGISFFFSKGKIKSIFKLIFLLQFWYLITALFGYIDFNNISENIASISSIFVMVNGVSYYSDLSPENSKHILDELHRQLKDLKLKNILSTEGFKKGGDPQRDLSFLGCPSLFLDVKHDHFNVDPEYLKNIKNLIHDSSMMDRINLHNKLLDFFKPGEMKEENIMLKYNYKLDPYFHHPYEISNMDHENKGLYNTKRYPPISADKANNSFFSFFRVFITRDIAEYNCLSGAKYYYESNDITKKFFLSTHYSNLWSNWHAGQASGSENKLDSIEFKGRYILNFYDPKRAYYELNDNMLIIGVGILCKVHVYTELEKFFLQQKEANIHVNNVLFYTKAWEYYEEAKIKYYPFFDHYNWYCKLHKLEHSTKSDILLHLYTFRIVADATDDMPDLDEATLNLGQKPNWHDMLDPFFTYDEVNPNGNFNLSTFKGDYTEGFYKDKYIDCLSKYTTTPKNQEFYNPKSIKPGCVLNYFYNNYSPFKHKVEWASPMESLKNLNNYEGEV